MPKRARPSPRDRSQARMDAFLSPRGGAFARLPRVAASPPPRRVAVGTSDGPGIARARGSASAFAPCPACGSSVALRLMNEHLDGPACGAPPPKQPTPAAARAKTNVHGHRSHTGGGGGSSRVHASSSLGASSSSLSRDDATASAASALRFRVEPALPGHFLVPDFVSPEEELALVAELDAIAPPWTPSSFNGAHSGKRWGVECDLARRVVRPARLEMPASLERLAARMRALGHPALANFRPNEANAISYRRDAGHRLDPHVDDRQLSGDVLVNLSLRGDCVMTYEPLRRKPPHAKKTNGSSMNRTTARGVEAAPPPRESSVRIELPRRSLQVQSGSARFDFAHGIRRDDLGDPRRVSVTFRESKTPTSKTRER